eukprot:6078710-Lingulodinium_polyedra.AAC.1
MATLSSSFLLPVFDLRAWQLQEVSWWSPMHFGSLDAHAPMGVAAVPQGDPCSVLEMAVRKAFWALPESFVEGLAVAE